MLVLLRARPTIRCLSSIWPSYTRPYSLTHQARFIPSRLPEIEYVEGYERGGFHPVAIGDNLAHGCYRIVHKLGCGGSSTIWLARDSRNGLLRTLKILRADMSSKPIDEISELAIPQRLMKTATFPNCLASAQLQTVEDHFALNGPNGSHICLVTKLAGPSLFAMSDAPGRTRGSKRLRSDLARKAAKQVVDTVELMHSAGFVHGDLTTSNVLFCTKENVQEMTDSDVYAHFGDPETETLRTRDHSPVGPHAPSELVAPIDNSLLAQSTYLQENILLIDFGQSFCGVEPPEGYEYGTLPHYWAPESRFEGQVNIMASDIWALACMIFEIRAGCPLFESFFGDDSDILKEIVATLGKPPEPWWRSLEERALWFDEYGNPKAPELQKALVPAIKSSIKQKLAEIGAQDDSPQSGTDGRMIEPLGTKLGELEIDLLGDLLGKMLRYRPEDRITIHEVASHPWFSL